MICEHERPCQIGLSSNVCALKQKAEAKKYDVNLTWIFAEVEPGIFALYNPVHRELMALGTWEEILLVYRAREPYVHRARDTTRSPLLASLEFKL